MERWSGGEWRTTPPSDNDRKLFDCLYSMGIFLERAGIKPDEVERRMIGELECAGIDNPLMTDINITGIFIRED